MQQMQLFTVQINTVDVSIINVKIEDCFKNITKSISQNCRLSDKECFNLLNIS